ncbi:MAG: hypothetical protein R2741_11065 [Methanolobus sp.]
MNEGKEDIQTKDEKITVPAVNKGKDPKEKTTEYYFKNGLLVVVGVIVGLSIFQLYFAVNEIIYTWFEYQYRPIFRSLYYLFVIVIGLFILNRYLTAKEKK